MEKTKSKKKIKVNIEDHIEHYQQIFDLLDFEIDRRCRHREGGAKVFRKVLKLTKKMRKELPVISRSKLAKIKRNGGSGLSMPLLISKELASFLELPSDTRLSRVETIRAICVYSRIKEGEEREEMKKWFYLNPDGKRNLQDPDNKMAIIPDEKLSRLLDYDQYCKDVENGLITKTVKNIEGEKEKKVVDDQSLYYWVIQKLLKNHFLSVDQELFNL
jgi:chromatin remodeling complex protein RSC6